MSVSVVGILSETDTGATSHTTASFTPVPGKLYMLGIHAKGTSPTPIPTISSSTGLNFVQVNTVDLNNRRLTVFRAMKASGLSSGTITISWASSVDNITIHLVELNGVDTSGTDGAGAVVQSNTVSAGAATSGTISLSAFGDANNGVLAFFGHNAGESATTPESGYSEIYDTFFGDSAMESEFKATQDTSPSATWSTSAAYRGIAIEIKQGAGTTLISVVEQAVAGSGGAGGIDSNTMLLLHCDGADGSTTFTDASQYAHSVSRVGIKVDTGQSKFSGASAQFVKTSNEEISSPDSSDWDFGSGDFTIDFWMRWNSSNSDMVFICQGDGTQAATAFDIHWNQSAGQIIANLFTSSTFYQIARVFSPSTGTWYHFALVRDGNGLKMFVDGNKMGSTQDITGVTVKNSSTRLTIGNYSDGSEPFDGWLDEIRISKGLARWTTNFTPPTVPYDTGGTPGIPNGSDSAVVSTPASPVQKSGTDSGTTTEIGGSAFLISVVEARPSGSVDSNVVLLLHADDVDGSTVFTDSSQYAHAISPNGNAQIDTAQSKFGGSSALFDGTSYLTSADSLDFEFGTGEFTIDLWVQFSALGIDRGLISNTNATLGWYFFWHTTKGLSFTYTGVNGTTYTPAAAWTPSLNVWYHVAVVQTGGVFKFFVNGTQIGSNVTALGGGIRTSPDLLTIGAEASIGYRPHSGWLDEIRVSKGIARWTGNFTPPTAPYESGASTVTEDATVTQPLLKSATDSGLGSDSSSVYISLSFTADDFGFSNDASSWSARYDVVDTGLGIEISSSIAKYSLVDFGLGNEITFSLFTPFFASDSGSGNDISSFGFSASDSGSGSEISAFSVAPYSAADSGSSNDVSTLVFRTSTTDSGSGSEISGNPARLSVSDSGSGSEASSLVAIGILVNDSSLGVTELPAVSTGTAKNVAEVGSGNEIATLKTAFAVTDETSAGIEGTATVIQNVVDVANGSDISTDASKASTDSGTGNEISVPSFSLSLTDSGTGNEISLSVLKSVFESGTATDDSTFIVVYPLTDTATATTIASFTYSAQTFDSGLLGNEISSSNAKISDMDVAGGDEIGLRQVTGFLVARTDAGSGRDSSFLHGSYVVSEFGIGHETSQFFGDFFVTPSSKASLIKTGSIPGTMVSVGSSQPTRLLSTRKSAPTIEAVN